MATATKLKSGNWRCKVYSHKDENGKKVYLSFTAPTKQQAEAKASKWAANKHRSSSAGMPLSECIDRYITAKTDTLSASTIRGYRGIQRRYLQDCYKDINKLTNEDVQYMINDWMEDLSPKTIKNIYGLMSAAIAFFSKDIEFNVTLPKITKKTRKAPSNEQVRQLYEAATPNLKKCILLAAFGSMRRSECCGLKYKDLNCNENGEYEEDTIYIHAARVQDENDQWIYQPWTKNEGSTRDVSLPHEVIELLGTGDPDDYVISYTPGSLTRMFIKLRDKLNIDIRYHDLRHYFATLGNLIGISDTVIADMGGWRHDSPILKNLYQGADNDTLKAQKKLMASQYFEVIKKD